jgi:FkbM family methyltransferase
MSLFRKLQDKWKQASGRKSYSLNDLDLKLKAYLNFQRGYFIEAGANDGLDQSNTLFFEKHRKWTGLLIEPIPQRAADCRRNRPHCAVENCALVPFGYPRDTIEMRYCNLMSLVKGAMRNESADMDHIKRGCEVQGISSYELMVPARTLTSVLDQYHPPSIDFFSLDVEGFELDVLKGMDFEKYRPKWMLVEARFRAELESFLKPWYEAAAQLSHHDVLYRRIKN